MTSRPHQPHRTATADLDALMGEGARVTVTPFKVVSCSWNTFEIRIRLGRGGLPVKDRLALVHGNHLDRWQFMFASHIWGTYRPWQVVDPAAPGFVTASCNRPGATVTLRVGNYGGLKPYMNEPDHLLHALRDRSRYVLEVLTDTPLRRGDVITLLYGDTRWGSPGVQAPALALPFYFLPFRYSLLPRYDRDLPIRQGHYDALPKVHVTGKAAVRLHVAAQPLVGTGEPFALLCAAVDEYGNRDESFVGELALTASDERATLPTTACFRPKHRGSLRLKGLRFQTPGWQTLRARSGRLTSKPLPFLVERQAPASRLYFGEMHGHTLDDDGTFPVQVHYDYARHTAGLDFASAACHAEYFGTLHAWRRYLDAATQANDPGHFVTFYGYEWAGEGHVNAYFMDEKHVAAFYGRRILRKKWPADVPPFRVPINRERRFLGRVATLDVPAICIAHFHTAYVAPVADTVVRLHEVYSTHQQNPLDEALQQVLARGIRVGVVSGSDTHRLPIGSLCPHPDTLWRQAVTVEGLPCSQSMQRKAGIQGTFAARLDRSSLWQAMNDRHTYGTTGARMVLLFSVNGVSMGREAPMPDDRCARIIARIGCQSPIQTVELFRFDGRRWSVARRWDRLRRLTADLTFTDVRLRGSLIYYLRVRQADGELGWTSPVWLTSSSPTSALELSSSRGASR